MSVKRNKFIKHLEQFGCLFERHGGKHDLYSNPSIKKKTTIPRHPQLDKGLCDLICKQLEVPKMK